MPLSGCSWPSWQKTSLRAAPGARRLSGLADGEHLQELGLPAALVVTDSRPAVVRRGVSVVVVEGGARRYLETVVEASDPHAAAAHMRALRTPRGGSDLRAVRQRNAGGPDDPVGAVLR